MMIRPSLSPFDRWVVIFPLGVYIIFNAVKEFFLDYIRQREQNFVNNLPTNKGAKNKGPIIEEGVKWKDLEIGSVIKLKRDEICPADIIVLDTSLIKNRENVCYVDTQLVDGKTLNDRKKATSLTKLDKNSVGKDDFTEYRKRLNGKLEYSAPTRALDAFEGYLKLKKDPKPEQLTIENLILRGSVLKNTDWVYGIVVYAGHNTKYMQNANYAISKSSYFERYTYTYIGYTAFVVFVFAAISEIVYRARSTDLATILQLETVDSGIGFFSYIVLYSPLLPISLYGSLDLVALLQRYKLQRKFAKAERQNSAMGIKVLNPDVLPNLGQISYCLIDKTGTLTTGAFKVRNIITTLKKYTIKDDITLKANIPSKIQLDSVSMKEVEAKNKTLIAQEEYLKKLGEKVNSLNLSGDVNFEINEEGERSNFNQNLGELKFKEELEHRQHNEVEMTGQIHIRQLSDVEQLLHETPRPNRAKGSKKPTQVILDEKMENASPVDLNDNLPAAEIFKAALGINADVLNKSFNTGELVIDLENADRTMSYLNEGLVLCHSARTRSQTTTGQYAFESVNPEEVSLLKLARSMGYGFEFSNRLDNPSIYNVKVKGKLVAYNVLGVNEFSYKRMRQSICVREPGKGPADPATLYVKGPNEAMKSRIAFTQADLDIYNNIIAGNNSKGYKTIVLARRTLDPTEANDFYKKYQNYKGSLYSQEEGLEQLANEVESKLEFVGVIGMQDEPRENAKQAILDLRASGIKCWMVTGDSQEQAISASYEFGFVDDKHETYYINPGDYEEVRGQVRNILAQIKRTFDEKDGKISVLSTGSSLKSLRTSVASKRSIAGKDRDSFRGTVILSSEAWKVILNDQYLYSNFAFICSVIGTIVAHSMTPLEKKKLVLMIKNRFVQPQSVMCIGDGLNDVLMLQAADVGIEISNLNHTKHPINAGDIKIHNFAPLKDLLLVDGRNFSYKIQQCVTFLFYKSYLIGLPLFYFNWFCSFTGSAQFESMMVFLYPFLFTFIPLIFFSTVGSHESELVLKRYPALYLDGRIQRLRANNKFLFDAVAKGIVQSAITFYLTIYCVQSSLGGDGKNPEFDIDMLVQYYATVTIATLDATLLYRSKNKLLSLPVVIFSLTLLLIYIFINESAQFVQSSYTSDTQHIFDRAPCVLVLVFSIFASLAISYLIRDHFFVKLFETFYEYFREGFVESFNLVGGSSFDNIEILRYSETVLKKANEIASIVRSVYHRTETIDSLVQEMLTTADFNSSEVGMNQYTLIFENKRLEKRYRRMVVLGDLTYLKVIYYLLIAVFSGYTIGVAVSNHDERLWVVRVVFIGIFIVMGFQIFTRYIKRYYNAITFLFLGTIFGFKILNDWLRQQDSSLSTGLMALVSVTNLNIATTILFASNFIHMVDFITRILIYYIVDFPFSGHTNDGIMTFYVVFSLILLLMAITALALLVGFNHEKQKRNEFLANTNLEVQQQKNSDILSLLVPKFVKDKLDRGQRTMADDQGEVGVLFLYLYQFDQIVNVEKTNIVRILDSIFREFDKICISNGVQKIETVMNTYMACAGLKSCEYNMSKSLKAIHPVRRLLNAAFQMREFMETVVYGSEGKPIKIKIGINYGRVIAGVIGYHKPQFSLVGDTVNTTSRVCSTGLVLRITISDAAYVHVKDNPFVFAKRIVPAKGKGDIVTWIVEKLIAKKNKINQKFKNIVNKHKEQIHELFLTISDAKTMDSQAPNDHENKTIKSAKDRGNLITKIQVDAKIIKAKIAQQLALDEVVVIKHDDDKESSERDFVEEQLPDDKIDLGDQLLKPHKLFLTFPRSQSVSSQEFEDYEHEQKKNLRLYCHFFLFIIYLIQTIVLIAARMNLGRDTLILVMRAVFLVILGLCLIFGRFLQKKVAYITVLLYLYGIIISCLQFYYSKDDIQYSGSYAEIELIELALLNLVVTSSCGLSFVTNLGVALSVITIWVVTYGMASALTLGNCFFFFVFILFCLIQVWVNRLGEIKSYNNLLIRNYKTTEQAVLVSQLLPAHAAEKYFNDPSSKNDILDIFEDVTLLFADVAGFTAYSASVEPAQVVEMVSALFTKFDKECVKYEIYKVYTIGDCYVAMGFINKDKRNPGREAHNMTQMAMEMVKIIEKTRKDINFEELNMRIGIHTGTLVGGITGTDIVRYDIYGPDVSIANKMESEGKKGFINVSERTRYWLEKHAPGVYRFESHTKVESFDRVIESFITYKKIQQNDDEDRTSNLAQQS